MSLRGEIVVADHFTTEEPRSSAAAQSKPEPETEPSGRYDFDLAEFPLFRFYKRRPQTESREPLIYSDTITGSSGERVPREWKAYPGPKGWGGASTQTLFYDLIQLYVEQGSTGRQIQFGTLRALHMRRGERHPSKADYGRLRRDLDVLCGYQFETKNAFFHRESGCYVDMTWRLFDSVFYFKEGPNRQDPFPFAFVEASSVLQEIARTRGFFAIGFPNRAFYGLKPLEQRLAIYLAKHFVSQKAHRRFVDDLAAALPIEAKRSDNVRAILKRAAQGLLDKEIPTLASFTLEKSKASGKWIATFIRKKRPKQDMPLARLALAEMAPEIEFLVSRIHEAVGEQTDQLWWSKCAKVVGHNGIDRALGQLSDAPGVRHKGKLLTKILKDIAREQGKALN